MTAIDQHKKCIAVLEMINDCDLIIDMANGYFARNTSNRIPAVEQGYKKDLVKYPAIKKRLQTYHHNLVKKIV